MATTIVGFRLAVAISILVASLCADAQPAGKVRHVGFLSAGTFVAGNPAFEAFRQGLREGGWIEGQNLVINSRYAEGRLDRLPDLAADLVRLKVDVIAASSGTPPAVAAKNATRTIPVVMIAVADPVGGGLIASLAHPGGNVTGLAFGVGTDTFGKGLALLKEAVPKVRRVAVLVNSANPGGMLAMTSVRDAAGSLGVRLQMLEVQQPNQFDIAFATMARDRAEALLVVADSLFVENRARLVDLEAKNRLPSMHGNRDYVDAGGLMSYGPSIVANFRRAAFFVDKILKGGNPADMPVEQPTKFELVINLKTAKALGLTIPQALLLRADQIIE